MAVQTGKPIGFVIAPTKVTSVTLSHRSQLSSRELLSAELEAVQASPLAKERTLLHANHASPNFLMGSFRPWESYQGSNEESAVDSYGGQGQSASDCSGKSRRSDTDATILTSWENTPLSLESQSKPIGVEWRKLNDQLMADENTLRHICGSFKLGIEIPSNLIEKIHGDVSPIAIRTRHFYESMGFSNIELKKEGTPEVIVRRFYFVRGATYRVMAVLALRGRRVGGYWEWNTADVAEMLVAAGQNFIEVARLLKKEGLMREAAEYYLESARLIEQASRRVHSLGEQIGNRLASASSVLSQELLNGYLEAYHIYENIHDYRCALRAAIVWARIPLRGWRSVSHEKIDGLPFSGEPNVSTVSRYLRETAYSLLSDAVKDFRKYTIDRDRLCTEDEALLEEAQRVLEKLQE